MRRAREGAAERDGVPSQRHFEEYEDSIEHLIARGKWTMDSAVYQQYQESAISYKVRDAKKGRAGGNVVPSL